MITRAQTKLGIFAQSLGGIAQVTPLLLLPLLIPLTLVLLGLLALAYILLAIDAIHEQFQRLNTARRMASAVKSKPLGEI